MRKCPDCGKQSLTTMGGTPHCRSCGVTWTWEHFFKLEGNEPQVTTATGEVKLDVFYEEATGL